jgi:hypothetical protein
MNVRFSEWVARRARAGDRLDVVVHEPFVDFAGGSWIQPLRGAAQRYMARLVVRHAHRVWLAIPGWEPRMRSRWVGLRTVAGLAPVPGTVPVHADPDAVTHVRAARVGSAGHLVGCFGAGGSYAGRALAAALPTLARRDCAFVCFGRGSDRVAHGLVRAVPSLASRVSAAGELSGPALSHHLQACDLLLQPYADGVSGRRTTVVSALEHGVPAATTRGALSELFWQHTAAVETVPAEMPATLADAVERLLVPARHAEARAAALALYRERFDPAVTLGPLLED